MRKLLAAERGADMNFGSRRLSFDAAPVTDFDSRRSSFDATPVTHLSRPSSGAGVTGPRTLPPLGRSSSETVLRCGQVQKSSALASRDSLGAGRVDPTMRALLAAAERNVDPKQLPGRTGSRSTARDADVSTRQAEATPPPPLRRSGSDTSLRCGQAQTYASPPRDSSNLGALKTDPMMRALLVAAQKIVDPKGLPASRPGSRSDIRRADTSAMQKDTAAFSNSAMLKDIVLANNRQPKESDSAQAVNPPKVEDEAAFVDLSKKLLKGSQKKHWSKERNTGAAPGTWGTCEEINKLNGALAGLGQQPQTMKWASPEIERLWLRKETTSQLLQSLLQNGTKVCSSSWMESENSTRVPNSTATSGYATPQLV